MREKVIPKREKARLCDANDRMGVLDGFFPTWQRVPVSPDLRPESLMGKGRGGRVREDTEMLS